MKDEHGDDVKLIWDNMKAIPPAAVSQGREHEAACRVPAEWRAECVWVWGVNGGKGLCAHCHARMSLIMAHPAGAGETVL